MKISGIFLLIMLSLGNISFAQVAWPTQPTEGYYENVKKLVMNRIPSESDLINVKYTAIPQGFKDTILKYDWYEIASYYFHEKDYRSDFLNNLEYRENTYPNIQLNFKRYSDTGVTYEMMLVRLKNGTVTAENTTLDETYSSKIVEVKKTGNKTFLIKEAFGEKEMIEIMSYDNGLLVLCVKHSPTSTTRKFHLAYMAVPKAF